MNPKVLLVEDDSLMGDLLFQELRKASFDVTRALNGKAAIEAMHAETFDVVLLDIILPDTNGFEVLQEVKSDPATKDMTVLILSNLSSEEDKAKGIKLGAENFFVKSNLLPSEVVEKIRAVIEKKSAATPSE